jgi:hypothetical protein
MLANDAPRPSEEHRGYEIHYVAGQRSWYIRTEEAGAGSKESYGSPFQARRAIDRILDTPQPVAGGKKKNKKG